MMVDLSLALEKQLISVFRFDCSDNGESECSFEFGNYLKEADYLQSVIQHLTTANRVITAILGHSKGGSVWSYVHLHIMILKTIVNVSVRCTMDRGIEERLRKYYLKRVKKMDLLTSNPKQVIHLQL
ncbi:hypothetical protein LXL04_007198 [Taraxacum kok-saghyz]